MTYTDYQHQCLHEEIQETRKELEALKKDTQLIKDRLLSEKWTNGDRVCPCCGEDKFKDLDADIWSDWQPKFCPNCGAKMIEPQESERTL